MRLTLRPRGRTCSKPWLRYVYARFVLSRAGILLQLITRFPREGEHSGSVRRAVRSMKWAGSDVGRVLV